MRKQVWYWIWGSFFIVCALLGFIPEPQGFLKWVLVLVSVAFFVPGAVLLHQAAEEGDLATIRLIRGISLASLVATLVFLVLNLICAPAEAVVGKLLYGFLVIFSSPMVCAQYWVVSLFLWACLLTASGSLLRKHRKK